VDKKPKVSMRPPSDTLKAEREQRGQQTPPTDAERRGATEQQVQPLTPPMADSDELPGDPKRKKDQGPDDQIDPAEELTPG
jgi:hypothetical protein